MRQVVKMSRTRGWFAAAAVGVIGLTASPSTQAATILDGYAAGSGSNTSHLVIDFKSEGSVYAFAYRYDGTASGADLLADLDEAGSLTVDSTQSTFNGQTALFVNGFSYNGQTTTAGEGQFMSYWLNDQAPTTQGQWTSASIGATDRTLTDGSYDGWIINRYEQPITNDPPAAVPSPEAGAQWAVLMLVVGVCLLGRRSIRL